MNNLATLEEMKEEAIKRMKFLGIFPETIRQFAEEGLVSESIAPFGAYFWVDDETKAKIKELEATDDEQGQKGLVYSGIRHRLYGDECVALLWVSQYKEEWEYEWEELKDNIVFAYVWNKDCDMNSEFGSIGVKLGIGAGLLRVA